MFRSPFAMSLVAFTFVLPVTGCVDASGDPDDAVVDPTEAPTLEGGFVLCTHVPESDPGAISFVQFGVGWVSNSCVNVDIPGLHPTSGVQSVTTARFTQFEKSFSSLTALSTAVAQCQASAVTMQGEFGNGTTFGAPFLTWSRPGVAKTTVDPLHALYRLDTCTAVSNTTCHPFHRDGGTVSRLHLTAPAGDGSTTGTKIFSSIRVNDPTVFDCSGDS